MGRAHRCSLNCLRFRTCTLEEAAPPLPRRTLGDLVPKRSYLRNTRTPPVTSLAKDSSLCSGCDRVLSMN
jgi:hypothetical protein